MASTEVSLVFTTQIGESAVKDTFNNIITTPDEDDVGEIADQLATFRGGTNKETQKITKITEVIE